MSPGLHCQVVREAGSGIGRSDFVRTITDTITTGTTHVVALEGIVSVSRDGGSKAVLAWRVVQFWIPRALHGTGGKLCVPLSLEPR
jgi:hypothetical protein